MGASTRRDGIAGTAPILPGSGAATVVMVTETVLLRIRWGVTLTDVTLSVMFFGGVVLIVTLGAATASRGECCACGGVAVVDDVCNDVGLSAVIVSVDSSWLVGASRWLGNGASRAAGQLEGLQLSMVKSIQLGELALSSGAEDSGNSPTIAVVAVTPCQFDSGQLLRSLVRAVQRIWSPKRWPCNV
eukprot:scpid89916/ scgid0605/ 